MSRCAATVNVILINRDLSTPSKFYTHSEEETVLLFTWLSPAGHQFNWEIMRFVVHTRCPCLHESMLLNSQVHIISLCCGKAAGNTEHKPLDSA